MHPTAYFRQIFGSLLSRRKGMLKRSHALVSMHLRREVFIDVYRPTTPPWRLLSLVVFNDGQDLPRMDFETTFAGMLRNREIGPTVVVGVHANDRLAEYGTAGRLGDQGRGQDADAYTAFILEELIPWVQHRYNIHNSPSRRSIAGFSLGGLSAFDIAWRHPGQFRNAGIFSGSLWYRFKPYDPDQPDAGRSVHDYVRRSKRESPSNRFWFMAGTEDETSDRNGNGIIDAIDDTIQLMAILKKKGWKNNADMTYVEVEGGRHEPETWGQVVGDFLRWIS